MNKKIYTLKKLDSLVGPLATSLVKAFFKPGIKDFKTPSSFLFIRPGGIGDAVLLIPAIKELKGAYPKSRIDLLCEKRNHEIFELCTDLDSIFLYDSLAGLTAALRGRYDVVIDSEQWYRLSAVVAYLIRSPMRIGFATNSRLKLFSHAVSYQEDEYEIYNFLRLISPLIPNPSFRNEAPFISVPDEITRRVDGHLNAAPEKRIIAIFPGGSVYEKRWPLERFRYVAEGLADRGYAIAAVGGKCDFNFGQKITKGLDSAVNLCGSLSLSETAAILSRASLLITGDSGILHIAFGVGTGTLSLFGPGNEIKWAPKGDIHKVLSGKIDCRPCTRFGNIPPCRHNIECMQLIDSEKVLKEAIKLLER